MKNTEAELVNQKYSPEYKKLKYQDISFIHPTLGEIEFSIYMKYF